MYRMLGLDLCSWHAGKQAAKGGQLRRRYERDGDAARAKAPGAAHAVRIALAAGRQVQVGHQVHALCRMRHSV